MKEIEEALDAALCQKNAAAWDRVDELARSAIAQRFTSPEQLKLLIALALKRKGIHLGDFHSDVDDWSDSLLVQMSNELERNACLQAQFSSIPYAVHSIDRKGRLVAVTDSWLQMLGYVDRSEVLGRLSTDFLDDASKEKAKTTLSRFWQDGYVMNCSYSMIRKSGQLVKVIFDAVCIRDANGDPINSICAVRVI